MGGLSIWHWMIVLVVVLLLFGTGKVSTLMGGLREGHQSIQEEHGRREMTSSMEASAERPAGSIAAPGVTTTTGPATPVRETTTVRSRLVSTTTSRLGTAYAGTGPG